MNPDQNITPIDENTNRPKKNKTLLIIILIIVLLGIAYLFLNLINSNLKRYQGTDTVNGQEKDGNFGNHNQKDAKYAISYLGDLKKGEFEIKAFPSVKFSISKIIRVEGLKMAGCSTDFPEEVSGLVHLAGCYNNNLNDPNISNESLIGIDIDVSNNSKSVVTGDIIKIIYYESRNGELVARLSSLGAVPFSSYSIEPLSDRKVYLHTWIPQDVRKIEIIYGLDDFTQYHSGLSDISNADGRIVVDFDQNAITNKVILK